MFHKVKSVNALPDFVLSVQFSEGITKTYDVKMLFERWPAFEKLKNKLREGDVVVILSFDRLARSTKMLLDLVDSFDEIGVDLISIKENIDTTTPQGKLFFTISAAFAEFERSMIKARQAEGIKVAKEQGRMTGRPKVDQDKLNTAIKMYQSGEFSVAKIQEITGISRSTLYREIDRRGISR